MGVTTEKVGRRVYAVGDTYPIKDRLRELGCHWDPMRRQWWISSTKATKLEQVVKCSGGTETSEENPETQDPDKIRLVGKARYKGRVYYVRWVGLTRKGIHMARLCSLDDSVDFWAKCAQPAETQFDGSGEVAVIIKTYNPRDYRGRTEYITLGSIRRFIKQEQENRAVGGPVCAACGKSGELVADLEDGLLKHRQCCDIEP